MKELTCIICPRGCHLLIDDDLKVTGNFCPRGARYAVEELTCPKRTLTSTMKTNDLVHPRVSVKTDKPIEKRLILEAMKEIDSKIVKLPIHIGDIIIKNVCGSDSNIVATRNLE